MESVKILRVNLIVAMCPQWYIYSIHFVNTTPHVLRYWIVKNQQIYIDDFGQSSVTSQLDNLILFMLVYLSRV